MCPSNGDNLQLCPSCYEWTEIDEETGGTCCCDVAPADPDPDPDPDPDLDMER